MYRLPEPINNELFNIQSNNAEISVNYIVDILQKHGICIASYQINNISILIYFTIANINGRISINRLEKLFSIEVVDNANIFMPTSGCWSDIYKYIINLLNINNEQRRARTLE